MFAIRSMIVCVVIVSLPTAVAANDPDGKASAACKSRVEKLIKTTARNMGLQTPFGLQLTERLSESKTVEFASGAFIVDEGYISNSGAVVTVSLTKNDCRIIKIAMTVRAP